MGGAASAALVGAPLALFVGTLVHPGLDTDAAAQLAIIDGAPGRWYATHLLGLVAMVLFVPGVVALGDLVSRSEPRWGRAGGALALAGVIGFTGIVTLFGFVAGEMAAQGDRAQMADLFHGLNTEPAVAGPIRGLAFAFPAGIACLAVGLHRARAAPAVACFAPLAGVLLFAVAGPTGHASLLIPATALMTVGFGVVALDRRRGA